MSDPTILTIGSLGYKMSSTQTPIAPAPTEEIVTSTPRMAPTMTVAAAVPRSSRTGRAAIEAHDAAAKHQDGGGQQQDAAEDNGDQAAGGFALIENGEEAKRDDGRRHAAHCQAPHYTPLDAARQSVDDAAGGLADGRGQQIGPDRSSRMNAEEENQQRRHQRAAADASHANQHTDRKTRKCVERIDHNYLRTHPNY